MAFGMGLNGMSVKMSDAPERIYMDPDIKFPECEKQYGCDVEYIRSDVAQAMVAAACEGLVDQAAGMADGRDEARYIEDQMREAIPGASRSALHALLKAEREKALREAARHAASATGDLELFNSILALISEDATAGHEEPEPRKTEGP